MGVGDELDIANVEDHVEGEALAGLLEDFNGFELGRGEWGDDASGGEAAERADVVGVPSIYISILYRKWEVEEGGGVLGVNTGILPTLEINHTSPNVLLLALGSLTLPIKVPNRLRESLKHIRSLLGEHIIHQMRRHNIRLTTFQRLRNTQQTHNIRVVSMEILTGIRPVNPDLVNLRRIFAQILNVTQDMAARVLAHKVTQVGAEAHVGDGGFVVAPFFDGEALKEDEAFAVEEILAQFLEALGQFGEGEVFLYYQPTNPFGHSVAGGDVPWKYQSKESYSPESYPTPYSTPQSPRARTHASTSQDARGNPPPSRP